MSFIVCSKLRVSQFLSTLERRKRVVGYVFLPGNSVHSLTHFTLPLIRIDYTSPPQYRQAALRVLKPILTAKMFKKNLNYLNIFFCLNEYPKNLSK